MCFSPEKHEKFKTCQENKSPIKLENFKPPEQGQDFVVSKFTRITPSAQDQVKFKYSEQAKALPTMNNIASVHEIAKEQMVHVKAEVAQISPVKTIFMQGNIALQKQELIIRDNTGSVQLVLWEKYVNSLEINGTYMLNNL